MRLEQLGGVFDEIKDSPIIGKGYGWNGYYMVNNGIHPVIVTFESLLMVVLANNGLIGIVLWTIFVFHTFKVNKSIMLDQQDNYLLNILLIAYISYSLLTGEYGYMKFYMMFYAVVSGVLLKNKNLYSNYE
jgi:hypothetical protein